MTDNMGRRQGMASGDSTEIDETNRLIASDKVEGTNVYGPDGDKIGSIHNFMVDKHSGKVAYAVMSFGGFLGMGERYHPLPWDTLNYDGRMGGYSVNVTKDELEGAPSYAAGEDPWQDPNYDRDVHTHYRLPYV